MASLSKHPSATPPLVPGVFWRHDDGFSPRMRKADSPETSLLVLRNRLYHGAGIGSAAAQALRDAHQDGLFALLRAVAAVANDADVIGRDDGRYCKAAEALRPGRETPL